MNVGKTIRKRRRMIAMSQMELAKKSDLTQTYISQIEAGYKLATLTAYSRIAEVLGYKNINVLLLMAIDIDDVPEEKKEIFKLLEGSLKSIVAALFDSNDRFN